MFRRKLLFALAAITAALAFAVPVVSASASATTTPGAQSLLCTLLHQQVLFSGGNSTLASLLASVLTYMHC
jgi:hypothetical protein